MTTDYFTPLDTYVATKAGEPYLWMPYGTIRKGDKTREVTPELAKTFKLPHFKPPIKVGSHDETTPAGGHIIAFDVREDGIWVTPELVPNGEKALLEGAYRYHSPEVIWADGTIQNPVTGEHEAGPFIMGDALLHTPHLGEKTALYSYETGDNSMETVAVPKDLWEIFKGMFNTKPTEPPAKQEPPKTDSAMTEKFTALQSELDTYKTQVETMKAEQDKTARVEKYTVEVGKTKAAGAGEMGALLAGLPDEQAEKVLTQFRALSAQIDDIALLAKKGGVVVNTGIASDPKAALNIAVQTKMAKEKLGYNEAYAIVVAEKPELLEAYLNAPQEKE